MKEKLLPILRCPEDGSELDVVSAEYEGSEIEEGQLRCRTKNHSYPILEGIPRFVATDAYVRSFSMEWTAHAVTQYDSHTGTKSSEKAFLLKTGFDPAPSRGQLVLDAGCGGGRFLDVARKTGADVVGLDLSYSVDAAMKVMGDMKNVHLIQGNIESPPFAPSTFDYIYSIGVLHHTKDTRESFLSLGRLLRKKGEIAIWVYPNGGLPIRLMNAFGGFYRRFAGIMSLPALYRVCASFQQRISVPRTMLEDTRLNPDRTLELGFHHPRQLVYLFLPFWSLARPYDWRVLDTFDYLAPRYQHKHTWREVQSWFAEAGLTDVKRLPIAVSFFGRKV